MILELLPTMRAATSSSLVILGDPHLLENERQDGSINPQWVLALERAKTLTFMVDDGVRAVNSVLANVRIALRDGVKSGVVDAAGLLANEAWLEEELRKL